MLGPHAFHRFRRRHQLIRHLARPTDIAQDALPRRYVQRLAKVSSVEPATMHDDALSFRHARASAFGLSGRGTPRRLQQPRRPIRRKQRQPKLPLARCYKTVQAPQEEHVRVGARIRQLALARARLGAVQQVHARRQRIALHEVRQDGHERIDADAASDEHEAAHVGGGRAARGEAEVAAGPHEQLLAEQLAHGAPQPRGGWVGGGVLHGELEGRGAAGRSGRRRRRDGEATRPREARDEDVEPHAGAELHCGARRSADGCFARRGGGAADGNAAGAIGDAQLQEADGRVHGYDGREGDAMDIGLAGRGGGAVDVVFVLRRQRGKRRVGRHGERAGCTSPEGAR